MEIMRLNKIWVNSRYHGSEGGYHRNWKTGMGPKEDEYAFLDRVNCSVRKLKSDISKFELWFGPDNESVAMTRTCWLERPKGEVFDLIEWMCESGGNEWEGSNEMWTWIARMKGEPRHRRRKIMVGYPMHMNWNDSDWQPAVAT